MVNSAYICFINKPVDENMVCILHNKDSPVHKHCGAIVEKGMPILVDVLTASCISDYPDTHVFW
jgi:hypothetical protein